MNSLLILATLSLSLVCICQANDVGSELRMCQANAVKSDLKLRPDLRALGQTLIQNAKVATQDIITIAKSIGGEVADTCVETSNDAIDNLNECVGYLKKTDKASIEDLKTKASAALTDIGTCDDEFGGSEPAKLKAASQKAQDFVRALLSVASKL